MKKPDKLSFSDEASFIFLRGEVIIFITILALGFILALVTTDVSLSDLALPCAAMGILGGIWVGIRGVISWGNRIGEKVAIHRMFTEEVWECWQFDSSEWRMLVEAESNLIRPKDDGMQAYKGAVYSSIFGGIIALILFAVGLFVVDDPDVGSVILISAVAIFLLLVGIGLFQPVFARYKAYLYRHKALRVAEPRVWFGPDGIYHETLGYTSLKELVKVTDQTVSRKRIKFTQAVITDTYDSSISYAVPVPTGCEDRAARLVRRYRQERI